MLRRVVARLQKIAAKAAAGGIGASVLQTAPTPLEKGVPGLGVIAPPMPAETPTHVPPASSSFGSPAMPAAPVSAAHPALAIDGALSTGLAVAAVTDAIKAHAEMPIVTIPTSSSASFEAFVGLGSKVSRCLRYDRIEAVAQPEELILAKQEMPQVYSFHCFHDAAPKDISERILLAPQSDRHFHVVFGRHIPCDLFFDIDDPWARNGEELLLRVLRQLDEEVKTRGCEVEQYAILTGNNPNKVSYHIHARMKNAVCSDFRVVRDIARNINEKLSTNAIDTQVYRWNGMFRLAYCIKLGNPLGMLVPLKDASLKGLAPYLASTKSLTDSQIVEMSFVNRPIVAPSVKVLRPPRITDARVYDGNGVLIPTFLRERNKWVRFKECTTELMKYPAEFCERYDTWIRVGISLHSFGHQDHILAHWERFSTRCMSKFDARNLRKRWEYFAKRNNPYNWQRGYNYLMHTIYGRRSIDFTQRKDRQYPSQLSAK